jgi:hypothetical protein
MTYKNKMNIAPLLSAGGLLGITKGYCTANSLDVENSTHLGTAAALGISHYVARNGSTEPLTISLSTGALFTAIMYGYYDNQNFLRWFLIGSTLGYVAETVGGKYYEEVNEKEDTDF